MAKKIEVTLKAVKLTKNCVVFGELDEDDALREPRDKEAVISRGVLYLSKASIKEAFGKKAPKTITLTVEA